MSIGIPQSGTPVIDTKTGMMTKVWWLYFQSLYGWVDNTSGTADEAVLAASNAQTAANNAQTSADSAATAAGAAQATANGAATTASGAQADATSALSQTAALSAIPFVTLTTSAALTSERVLTQGANIVITDGGAGGAVSVALAPDITGTALAMTIQPKIPSTTDAGQLTVKGADSAAHNGGDVWVIGGNGVVPGSLVMAGGDGVGVNAQGGSFTAYGGTATGVGTPGDVLFTAGVGTTHGGVIKFIGGNTGTDVITITDDGTNNKLAFFGASPVLQSTGWGSPTGTATKTTFDTATVTLPQLAEHVKALIDYMLSRGDLGH